MTTNSVLTNPEPGRFEIVERPYPRIKAGYAIVETEIAPVCLEGTRIWAAHDFEFHDDPTHLGLFAFLLLRKRSVSSTAPVRAA